MKKLEIQIEIEKMKENVYKESVKKKMKSRKIIFHLYNVFFLSPLI